MTVDTIEEEQRKSLLCTITVVLQGPSSWRFSISFSHRVTGLKKVSCPETMQRIVSSNGEVIITFLITHP